MVYKKLILASSIALTLFACKKESSTTNTLPYTDEKFSIYPKPTVATSAGSTNRTGWVGDVMPYYVNNQFELFFLHDAPDKAKQSSTGQHDIHKFSSKDLLNFSYDGQAISYGTAATQDQLVGTGSMVKVGDTYYFYYTGHNSSSSWLQNNNPAWTGGNSREAVMYATSKDMKTWTKKTSFALRASDGYSSTDFRDPYVFYNDEFKEYWMLVSTQQAGKGIILVYKSADPAMDNWQIRGPLTVEGSYLMLECADIVKIGDKYYLFFGEDWSNTPGTHYRVASSTAGPWVKPADGNDMFDGHQFYAGRMASNGTTNYTFGWAHRRNPENDNGTRTWGGNLISHELVKLSNDKLGVKSPAAVRAYFTKETAVEVKGQTGTVKQTGTQYTLTGSAALALYKFANMDGTSRIQGGITFSNLTGTASLGFNTKADNTSSYVIKFEPAAKRIAAYNNGVEVTRVPFNFQAGKNYDFSIVADGSIAVLYVNDEIALTNRIYSMNGNMWSLSAEGMEISASNLKVIKH
ncbi:glycoside hydrolase family 32 protein [Mucilaginibacter terrae]|uniref:beta-fructofuranosidase n=1 Tax=Mucilaginibacter terrae TaxID=1955052 RepID=A0ABU3GX10_9SPHI|nr:glycoside hydrolase family 32 protein [Mucilaginibacter terrae]MDT3404303.1 beta-fructofuranosidase [Mucilaginibacter terrae]